MCGIAGLVDFGRNTNLDTLKKMTDVLFHRGPDDGGYFFEGFEQSQVGLGHRRLSILDLSKHGHQPMAFGHLTIVYNGEVYNFKEIREELEKQDYRFESNSDTEVILKAYHQWGMDAVHRFNGMFAIAIFDNQKQTLTLIRDRAGVKPLYWYQKDGLFMFASELKSFHEHPSFVKELNHDGLALFLQYGYIPQPHTIFENTHKLKAGHSLELNTQNFQLKIQKYWDVIDCYDQPKLDITETEAIRETERLLKSACEYRMVADVPVGMFLSGGYDSTAVTALLQAERTEKLKTFTIGFHEKKFNEAKFANKISKHLGTDHVEYYCSQKDALEIFPRLTEIWDEPFGDVSVIPTLLVSQLAKNDVKVSLSADGGDEIFGGYKKYNNALNIYSKLDILPFRKKISEQMEKINILKAPYVRTRENLKRRYARLTDVLKSKDCIQVMESITRVFTKKELNYLLKNDFRYIETDFEDTSKFKKTDDDLDKILGIDYKTYQLDNILPKVDRATMSVGLEGREPLLDFRLIEYVARLTPKIKIKNGVNKYLLKEITHKYIPKDIMDRPKMGFGIPLDDWLKDGLAEYLLVYLSKDYLRKTNVFNVDYVINLRNAYFEDKGVNTRQLWLILIFQMWHKKWL